MNLLILFGVRDSSVADKSKIMQWVVASIPYGGPFKPVLFPTGVTKTMVCTIM